MRRVLLLVLATALGLAAYARQVKVDTFVANAGARVTVPVSIDSVEGLAYASVRVAYDPQVLVLVKAGEGTLVKWLADDFVVTADEKRGVVSISAFGTTNVQAAVSGTLARLTFYVREGTAGKISDVTLASVELGEASGVKDVTVGDAIAAVNGMVRVVAPSADVERLEKPQTIVADTRVGSLMLKAGDALQASDAQTPICVSGAVSAGGAIAVREPVNGWASGRYELLKTTTAGLAFEIADVDAAFSAVTNGAYVTYVAEIRKGGELPVIVAEDLEEKLSAGTMNQIRGNIAKSSFAQALTNATSIAVGGPDGLIGITADMGIAPRLVAVDEAGVARFTYAKPTVAITSFEPETGHVRIRVEPGSGNEIVSELATGYVHAYGTDDLGEKMRYISKVKFDLAPYLQPETKGEADLIFEVGTHTFLKIKVEAVEKAEGATE